MALSRIPDLLRAFRQHQLEDLSLVVGRASHNEIVGPRPPSFLQPLEVGFESARGQHYSLGADGDFPVANSRARGAEPAVLDLEIDDFRVIKYLPALALGRRVFTVDQGFAAA